MKTLSKDSDSFYQTILELANRYADILWSKVRFWDCGAFSIRSRMDRNDIYQEIVCIALERHKLDRSKNALYYVKYASSRVWKKLRRICNRFELPFMEEIFDEESEM